MTYPSPKTNAARGVIVSVVFACSAVVFGAPSDPKPPAVAVQVVGRELGNVDPLVPGRIAQRLSVDDLVDLIYRGPDHLRLPAIESFGALADPWPVLPTLAALSAAGQRPVASAASRALLTALESWSSRQRRAGSEVMAPEADAVADQLRSIVKDPRLDVDIRGVALRGILELGRAGFEIAPVDPMPLLEDDDPEVRALGVAAVALPIESDSLPAELARQAEREPDPVLRGQLVGILCENALLHNARKPSKDLHSLILDLFEEEDFGACAFAPALACLSEFSTEARIDLIDRALSHSDEEISKLWSRLAAED